MQTGLRSRSNLCIDHVFMYDCDLRSPICVLTCALKCGALTPAHNPCAQKYTIRDLTTGKLFVLDSADSVPGSPAADADGSCAGADAGPAAAVPAAVALARQVTDVQSGRGMTLDEFDQALGLHSALKARTGGALACSMSRWQWTQDPHISKEAELSFHCFSRLAHSIA